MDNLITLSAEELKQFCRFELTTESLIKGEDVSLWAEQYQITLEDLHTALKNIKKDQVGQDKIKEWFEILNVTFYDCIEVWNAVDCEETTEERIAGLPDIYSVFDQVWYMLKCNYEYENADFSVDEMLRVIERYYENKEKPLTKREFSYKEKVVFLSCWEDRIENANDETVELYRNFTNELCENNEEVALRIKGYDSYGNGSRAFEKNWFVARDCMLKLMEVNPTPVYANTLGYIYYYGRCNNGVPEYDKAFYYFSVGAAGGVYESRYKIADMFNSGYGVKKNKETAFNIINELYEQNLEHFLDGHTDCKFADIAFRLGNFYKEDGSYGHAYKCYLQAYYAIELRIKKYNFYGDKKVYESIKREIESVKCSYDKPKSKVYLWTLEWLFKPVLLKKRKLELKLKKIGDDNYRAIVRVCPYGDEAAEPKMLVDVPEFGFCGMCNSIMITVRNIEEILGFEKNDSVFFDDVDAKSFYFHG